MIDPESLIQAAAQSVWYKLCCHTDGIAIGTTVSALARKGFFDLLCGTSAPLPVSELIAATGAREGYLHLACKLLAGQGFLSRKGYPRLGSAQVALTDSGREWVRFIKAYERVPAVVQAAMSFPGYLDDPASFDRGIGRLLAAPETDVSDMGQRVRLQIQGPFVGAVLKELARRGILDAFGPGPGDTLALTTLREYGEPLELGVDALVEIGWMVRDGAAAALTLEGRIARLAVPQYFYPVGYLPTFRNVPRLLFGQKPAAPARDEEGIEQHVDRALDIAFSGQVFSRLCRETFLEIVLPLFDRGAIEDQPRCVVDTGAGDGALLVDLYSAIRDRTLRGKYLGTHPLLLIAAEYNPVAQETADTRLDAAGIPHLAIFGDIGDPAGIAQELARRDIDPLDALHVSKSVIHNRTYFPPRNREAARSWRATSNSVFIDTNGKPIAAGDLERNLVEHFEQWIPWIKRHGMVVIEAHTVDPEAAARSAGRNIITSLDAAHGYSHQYLVEIEVQRKAALAAGLVSKASRDLAGEMVGRPILSIDHFIPAAHRERT